LLTLETDLDAWINKPLDKNSQFYVEHPEDLNGLPTAMFHGYGGNCLEPGNIYFN
jgi:hypothetical protein